MAEECPLTPPAIGPCTNVQSQFSKVSGLCTNVQRPETAENPPCTDVQGRVSSVPGRCTNVQRPETAENQPCTDVQGRVSVCQVGARTCSGREQSPIGRTRTCNAACRAPRSRAQTCEAQGQARVRTARSCTARQRPGTGHGASHGSAVSGTGPDPSVTLPPSGRVANGAARRLKPRVETVAPRACRWPSSPRPPPR
jgi:hypothetical protein